MKKILVVNPFGLGDAIFSLFLVEAVRRERPDAVVDFLGNERAEPLLKMSESVRRVHVFHRDGFRRAWPRGKFWKSASSLFSAVRAERYEAMFDLSLGREFAFYGWLAGIPRRVGFGYKGRGTFLTRKIPLAGYEGRQVARIQLDLLPAAGLKIPELPGRLPLRISKPAEEAARRRLAEAGFGGGAFVAVSPGGGRSWGENAVYKQWSPERFAQVLRRLSARGLGAVLLGDEAEKALLERVWDLARTPAILCAGAPIGEVCAILRAGRGLLANDGGLVHLASALGVKTTAIFGPVDERVYGPFEPVGGSRILIEPVPCRPCYSRFRFPPCPNARVCLEALPADRVVEAVLEMV